MSKASPVAIVGCKKKNKMIGSSILTQCKSSNYNYIIMFLYLRLGSRQFFKFLLVEPVVWMNCLVPLSDEHTLLFLMFVFLYKEEKNKVFHVNSYDYSPRDKPVHNKYQREVLQQGKSYGLSSAITYDW